MWSTRITMYAWILWRGRKRGQGTKSGVSESLRVEARFRWCFREDRVRMHHGRELSYLLQVEHWYRRGKWSGWNDEGSSQGWSVVSNDYGREAGRYVKLAWAVVDMLSRKISVRMKVSIVRIWAWRSAGWLWAEKHKVSRKYRYCYYSSTMTMLAWTNWG